MTTNNDLHDSLNLIYNFEKKQRDEGMRVDSL